jgi:aspartyl/asparaginyl-tRNA synthetase
MEGKVISLRARVHTLRRMSARLVFIVLRQQTITIQGVLQSFEENGDTQRMLMARQFKCKVNHRYTRWRQPKQHLRTDGSKCGALR